ncbi:hypothetical protein CWI38_0232p0010 [Hamiltosporidium tvaerminnensis]|uniref:Uncharacterized protein n=1 Tax=Hamiltosporidium tvaerminnensis TaxID=1176355 RepID=A0A4Q9M0F7_9MICR|nr:hypothetical protein CWI38_0232p0010 [Hamiltosporidium tvaerminnensis]
MIHLWLGCKERLYFSITELERGLHSVEQAATLNVENSNKTHLALIKCFLKVKYRLEEELYNGRRNELVSDSYAILQSSAIPKIEMYSEKICQNEYAEIRKNTRTKIDAKIVKNFLYIVIFIKRKNKITLIEVGITSQGSLRIPGLIYKCNVEKILYVMTWNGIVSEYHNIYPKRLNSEESWESESKGSDLEEVATLVKKVEEMIKIVNTLYLSKFIELNKSDT